MSRPRYDWWGYVKGMIRRYPTLKAEREALKGVSLVADYSGMPHTGGVASGTEAAALKVLPGVKEREYQAVYSAIERTKAMPLGRERLKLVEMVFWRRSHTLSGAAGECHVSERTARRWHTEFIRAAAEEFGLMDG